MSTHTYSAREREEYRRKIQRYAAVLAEIVRKSPAVSHPFAYFRKRALYAQCPGVPWIGPMNSGGRVYARRGTTIVISMRGEYIIRREHKT